MSTAVIHPASKLHLAVILSQIGVLRSIWRSELRIWHYAGLLALQGQLAITETLPHTLA
jgi:hypothetical protein